MADRSGLSGGASDDDLLARSVEALAVLLDAGISPGAVWTYLAEESEHPAIGRAARSIAAGAPPSDALVDAARWRRVTGSRRAWWGGLQAVETAVGVEASRAGVAGDQGAAVVVAGDHGAAAALAGDRGAAAALAGNRGAAVVAGDHGVAAVAAAWGVAEHAGAALAPALRGAANALRDRAETVRDVETAVAGPRATARLMAWLPLVGVAMAYVIGVDVVGALVGAPLGWGVAVLGAGLMLAGGGWTARLVRDAARAGPIAGVEHDLMAIALAGGMSTAGARQVVAEVGGRSGLRPASDDGRSVDRVLRIAERAGAPAIELLSAEARQQRRRARAVGRRRAELVGVRLLLPLGVCVLPAFVLLGVVPVILAMMSSTFTGLT